MRVVIDTNVWVSGLISPASKPGRVIAAVQAKRLTPFADWDLLAEFVEVSGRAKFGSYAFTQEDIDGIVDFLTPVLPGTDIELEPRDPMDRPVISSAVSGKVDAIITGDRGLLEHRELREHLRAVGILLLTPTEIVDQLQL